ncbi:hypothetical protein Avbf_05563 [Armadillidium vulgare]|nr:hypothetical protein Avbf_05563 [Armadillidium vulgare]
MTFQDGLNVWLYKQNLRDDKNSLTKNLMFKIEKDPLEAKVRILCCFQTENPHNGILKKSMQGRRYIFQCGERDRIQDLHEGLRTFYGYNMIYNACLDLGAELFPIYIQDIHDVPKSLIENGAFQKDLVRPGLYRAVHKIRDDLLILLSYKENLRINGFLVQMLLEDHWQWKFY